MKYLFIDAEDDLSQDLTQYFPKCLKFIHKARANGGNVFVHWYMTSLLYFFFYSETISMIFAV